MDNAKRFAGPLCGYSVCNLKAKFPLLCLGTHLPSHLQDISVRAQDRRNLAKFVVGFAPVAKPEPALGGLKVQSVSAMSRAMNWVGFDAQRVPKRS